MGVTNPRRLASELDNLARFANEFLQVILVSFSKDLIYLINLDIIEFNIS